MKDRHSEPEAQDSQRLIDQPGGETQPVTGPYGSGASEASGGLMGSATVVAGATAVSRALGLVRVQLMAYFFGASVAADAFFIAFRAPNLFRDLFAEGTLSTAFVPVFKKTLETEGQGRAEILGNRMLTMLTVVLLVVCALGIAASPWLVKAIAAGFADDPDKFELTVSLTRWIFPYLLLVSVSAALMGILNSYGKFGSPAFASSMFNIGWIVSMLTLYNQFEEPIYCLVVGVLAGGVGQVVIQLPTLMRLGHKLKLDFHFKDRGIKEVGKLMTPMLIGLGAGRVNIMVSSLLASLQVGGAVSYLSYAYQLMHFPLGVFAVAIGTVALPKVSGHVARGEISRVARTLESAVRMMLFLVVPSTVYLTFFNEGLVKLVYERGAFSAADTAAVQLTLFWYTVGLLAFAGVRVVTPIYYGFSDSKTPMRYSIYSIVVNIILSFALVYIPIFDMGFAGLAAATSFAAWLNFGQLLWGLKPRNLYERKNEYIDAIWKTVLSSILMGLVLFFQPFELAFGLAGLAGKILTVSLEIAIGGVIYFVSTSLLRMREATLLLKKLRILR